MWRRVATVVILTPLLSTACSSDEPKRRGGGGGGGNENPNLPLATAVGIARVEVNQAVAVSIMEGGSEVTNRNAPVVEGRHAMVRVYVEPAPEWQPRALTGKLHVEAGGEVETFLDQDASKVLSGPSDDGNLASTLNFELPAGKLTADAAYSVELAEFEKGASFPGTTAGATWPADGTKISFKTESSKGPIVVVLVPYKYQADGSGRVPNTDPDWIQQYYEQFLYAYPVPEVELVVREPVTLSSAVSPNGSGWQQWLQKNCSIRAQDNPPGNHYYHGIADPAQSYQAFCGGGCVGGLAGGGGSPGDSSYHCSVGIGFQAPFTLVSAYHEVGHTLGRMHAPCSDFGQIQGVDGGYPYPQGRIGVWGLDFETKQLFDPDVYRDFMGYCEKRWVSDYTYKAIFKRLALVNGQAIFFPPASREVAAASAHEARVAHRAIVVEIDGSLHWGRRMDLDRTPLGVAEQVELRDAAGARLEVVEAQYFPTDDLPGGSMLFPEIDLSRVRSVYLPGRGRALKVPASFAEIDL